MLVWVAHLGLVIVHSSLINWNAYMLNAAALNIAVFGVSIPLARPLRHVRMPAFRAHWTDLVMRAALVALLVGFTVTFSFQLGPGGSGIMAVFPVILLSIMFILHKRVGGPPAAAVLANAPLGLVGFAFACIVLHFTAEPFGGAIGLALALATSWLAWSLTVLLAHAAKRHSGIDVIARHDANEASDDRGYRRPRIVDRRAQRTLHRLDGGFAADRGWRGADHLKADHPLISRSAIGSMVSNPIVAVSSRSPTPRWRSGVRSSSVSGSPMSSGSVARRCRGSSTCDAASVILLSAAVPADDFRREILSSRKCGKTKAALTANDLLWRAVVVTLSVVLVTAASSMIGSYFSGIFAFFPIAMGSYFVILHPRIGGPATASVAAHVQAPLIGLGLGLVAVHLMAEAVGVWWAYAAGLAIAIAWNAALAVWRSRQKLA